MKPVGVMYETCGRDSDVVARLGKEGLRELLLRVAGVCCTSAAQRLATAHGRPGASSTARGIR